MEAWKKRSKENTMTRSNAREIACHLVFEMNFNDITAGEALRTLMEESYYPTLKGETDV